MGYPVKGLCQSLAIIKTSSGVTGWLLQAKHLRCWVFLSEQGGREGYGLDCFVGLISPLTTQP